MLNDNGGINGRRLNFITLDDSYSPPKAVEHARRLIEQDRVALMFSPLATAVEHVLGQCGDDLSREKIMRPALGIRKFAPPIAPPGLVIDTSPENHLPS